MKLGAAVRAPCTLEQPRKSKMKKLPEWIFLLEAGLAYEEWLASCMYGSPHKKEFVFLAANVALHPLHLKCSGDHVHVPIQGAFTKPSATYTDALAAAFASWFDVALAQKKLRVQKIFEVKTGGLETPMYNDVFVSGDWKAEKSWRWRKPGHISV